MRWSTDVDVWTSRGARDSRTKRRIRNSVSLEKIQQRLTFGAIRMKLYVHRVAMVEAPAFVNRALAEDGDREFVFERVGKEPLDLVSLAKIPTRAAGEPNERRRANETLFREIQVLCELFTGLLLDEYGRDLIVGSGHLAPCVSYLLLRGRQGSFVFFNLCLCDEAFGKQFP